jgi:hypothetical protein
MWMMCAIVAVIGWILIGKLPQSANYKKQQTEISVKTGTAAASGSGVAGVEMGAVNGGRADVDANDAVIVTVNGREAADGVIGKAAHASDENTSMR